MYDPSPAVGGPPTPGHLAAMQRQVEAHALSERRDPKATKRWGLFGWAVTVCLLLGVFGVLPELLTTETVAPEAHVDALAAVP